MSTNRNWAHRPEFDPAAMADFERRLGQARPPHRPGYLRVKAATLLQQPDEAAVPVAIDLLLRVVTESDHFLEVPFSHELLGRAYRRSGDLAAAEAHFRLAIETADDHRNGLALPELELAEITLEAGRYEDATAALQALELLERGMVWNSQLYRHAVTKARLANLSGGDPVPWATRALELAAETGPQLARHPTVGLVDAPREELREMKHLAKPKTKPRWRRA